MHSSSSESMADDVNVHQRLDLQTRHILACTPQWCLVRRPGNRSFENDTFKILNTSKTLGPSSFLCVGDYDRNRTYRIWTGGNSANFHPWDETKVDITAPDSTQLNTTVTTVFHLYTKTDIEDNFGQNSGWLRITTVLCRACGGLDV